MKFSLHARHYAQACNEWPGPSPHLTPGQPSSEETSQRRRGLAETVRFDRPVYQTLGLITMCLTTGC